MTIILQKPPGIPQIIIRCRLDTYCQRFCPTGFSSYEMYDGLVHMGICLPEIMSTWAFICVPPQLPTPLNLFHFIFVLNNCFVCKQDTSSSKTTDGSSYKKVGCHRKTVRLQRSMLFKISLGLKTTKCQVETMPTHGFFCCNYTVLKNFTLFTFTITSSDVGRFS